MKFNNYLVIGLFSLLVLTSFASAASKSIVSDIKSIGQGGLDILKPVSEAILGSASSGDILFAKVLLFIIVLMIVNSAINMMYSKGGAISWLISAAVSVLAIRWIAESWIYAIILPYSTIGVVITAALPFVIFFFLVNMGMKDQPGIIRRMCWIFFTVIFIGLWVFRYDSLPAGDEGALYIYPITALLALIMAWMDGTISRFFGRIRVEKQIRLFDDKEYMRRYRENKEFYEQYTQAMKNGDDAQAKRIWEKIQRNEESMASLEAGTFDRSGNGGLGWKI